MHEQLVSELRSIFIFFLVPMLILDIISRLRRKPYPPGPWGLPIIGNIMMAKRLNHRGLAKLAKHYGGLFHLKMGSVHVIVVIGPEEAKQRRMRKLSVMRLFSRKRTTTWESVRSEDEFLAVLQELSQLFGALNIADFIPFLTWADPNGLNERLVKAQSDLDGFFDPIIDNGKINEPEDSTNSLKLTRDNIKAIIMDVTFGATETVAWTVEWAMTELLRNPDDMKRVQNELANVAGLTRKPDDSDLDKLPYFRCCIKETLRLHPPVSLLLHATSHDAVIGGYYIPKQSRVVVNTWAIGRDPNSWSDADMFKPGRFLEEGAPNIKGANFELIPFGSGRQSCPGMGLALYTLELCAVNLLHCFTWELPDGMKPSELRTDETFGLTISRASRLVAVPSTRLVCPL
uniref:Uncharacterized protein n=1 Tax=Chenopodium quinoa TaxID=63459 RepID=A0A803L0E6_CHEQI